MEGDRPRALFFVLALLAMLAVLYFIHLRNEAARIAATVGSKKATTVSSLLALLGDDTPTATMPSRPELQPPQHIAVRVEGSELRATGPVRIGNMPTADARFIFREEAGWLIVEKVRIGATEQPCRGIMKKSGHRLALGRCGEKAEKTSKEMNKNLINE